MAKLSSVLLPDTAGTLNPTGEQFKGAGYRNVGNGQHTVQVITTNCTGRFYIEGTLASDPASTDWFPIQLDGATDFIQFTADTGSYYYTFTSNLIWVRARLDRTYDGVLTLGNSGSLDQVLLQF